MSDYQSTHTGAEIDSAVTKILGTNIHYNWTNGYVMLGTILIKFGTISVKTGTSASNSMYSGSSTVTFDTTYAFDSTPQVTLTLTGAYTTSRYCTASSQSTTGFTANLYTSSSSQTRTLNWIAIGHYTGE